ncbi:hypothetical protein [Roseivirga sp.]|uniref:hypothetical protein n=1 Tax=Roseivirga sp. TaxID=1964215 RepID=UPI003B52BDB3
MKLQLLLTFWAILLLSNEITAQQSAFDQIKLISVKNLESNRPATDEIYLEDLIEFEISKPDSIRLREPQELFLYINGYRLSPYQAKYVTSKSVVFELFATDTLRGLLNRDINSWGIHEAKVRMSFGNKEGEHIHLDESNIIIDFDPNFDLRSWIGRGIIVLVIVVFFVLVRENSFLKAGGSSKYSLSRVQLAWWTMIVLCCYIALWSDSGILVPLTSDTLILIGISAGTAATAQTIDISRIRQLKSKDEKAEIEPVNAIHKDQSFLFQILSDHAGINIQRFQSVVFTFFIGVFFVFEVITKFEMPDLDPGILGLMGISSATYAGLKTNEGKV